MIRHVAGIAEIVDDFDAGVRFYREVLGLTVEQEPGSGYAVVAVPGVLHFAVWARWAAAEGTFGSREQADRIPLGLTVGFEVDGVEEAHRTLTARGWPVAQPPKVEEWGQTTSRFFSPSGALCEVSETPGARRLTQGLSAADPEDDSAGGPGH